MIFINSPLVISSPLSPTKKRTLFSRLPPKRADDYQLLFRDFSSTIIPHTRSIHRESRSVMISQYSYNRTLVNIPQVAVLSLASSSTLTGTAACGPITVLDLSPQAIYALDLSPKYTSAKRISYFKTGYVHVLHQSCRSRRNAYLHSKIGNRCSYVFGRSRSRGRRRL
jgi:hypothetical protein